MLRHTGDCEHARLFPPRPATQRRWSEAFARARAAGACGHSQRGSARNVGRPAARLGNAPPHRSQRPLRGDGAR